jgi:hypothetical protein
MVIRSIVFVVLLVTLHGAATLPIAKAEMLVLESNVPEFQKGVRLPDGTVFVLPVGGRVKVLLSSTETKVFKGPTPSRSLDPYGGTRAPRTQN